MKLTSTARHGFSLTMIIALVLSVGIVGLLGYVAYDRFIAVDTDSQVVEQSAVAEDMEAVTTSVPDEIVDTADLDEAISSLDKVTDTETEDDVDLISSEVDAF